MKRFALALSLVVPVAASSLATITYSLRPADASSLIVTMEFDAKGKTTLKMPNWAPGAYLYSSAPKSVTNLTVAQGRSRAEATKVGDNGWSFDARGPVRVTYSVPNGMADGSYSISGPSTYLYVDGRKEEKCILKIDAPAEYKVAVGLEPVSARDDRQFTAPNYDTLADNPITLGDFLTDSYTVMGKPHLIVLRGSAREDVDRRKLVGICRSITASQGDFFGGLPYQRYVWHFTVGDRVDGGGGLEHLSSTQISLPSGLGPRAVGVLAHEFFHLWNVKRIRSAPLGPFDYDTLPQTGALWWLEGVTDYYAHTLLSRYSIWTKEDLYRSIVNNVRAVRARPDRMNISPYESSFRVRDAANGRGNSQGYKVSYYDTGWVIGMILDLAMIDETKGRHSLDSIELDLARTYARGPQPGQKRGFEEGRLHDLALKYGGPKIAELYDTTVMKPGELPVEAALARAGLEMITAETRTVVLPFTLNPNREKGGPVASQTGEGKVLDGRTVTAIGGVNLLGATLREQAEAITRSNAALVLGTPVAVEFTDAEGKRARVMITPIERVTSGLKIGEKADATPRQLEVRRLWMSKRRSRN